MYCTNICFSIRLDYLFIHFDFLSVVSANLNFVLSFVVNMISIIHSSCGYMPLVPSQFVPTLFVFVS